MTTSTVGLKMISFSVEDYERDSIAMTVGHAGKNFIKWTESTDGICRIWHNKTTNEIEISGIDCPEKTFCDVKKIITGVLDFNSQILKNKCCDIE